MGVEHLHGRCICLRELLSTRCTGDGFACEDVWEMSELGEDAFEWAMKLVREMYGEMKLCGRDLSLRYCMGRLYDS